MTGTIEPGQSADLDKVDGSCLLFTVSFSAIAACIVITTINFLKPGVRRSLDKKALAANAGADNSEKRGGYS